MSSTTIAVKNEVKDKLQTVKHRLEKERHKECSYSDAVEYLIDKEEKNGKSDQTS